MPYTEADVLERFQTEFASNFRPICSDKFASHILQKMVEVAFLRAVAKLQTPVEQAAPSLIARKRKATEEQIPDEKQFNLSHTFEDEHIGITISLN